MSAWLELGYGNDKEINETRTDKVKYDGSHSRATCCSLYVTARLYYFLCYSMLDGMGGKWEGRLASIWGSARSD
jgi:hypothetical protein